MRALLGLALAVPVSLLVGCGEQLATEAAAPTSGIESLTASRSASPQSYSSGVEISASDGSTTLTIDANGDISISGGPGGTVYLEADGDSRAQLANLAVSLNQGDVLDEALGEVDPYGGGGMEPMALPGGPGRKLHVSGIPNTLSRNGVLLRRSGSSTAMRLASPVSSYGTNSFSFVDCQDILTSIGQSRMQYHMLRRGTFSGLRDLKNLPASMAANGRMTVSAGDVAGALMGIATNFVDIWAQTIQMSILTELYNINNCSQPIWVNIPFQGGGFVVPSNNTTNPSAYCYSTVEPWEISFDGGLTWKRQDVVVTRCTPAAS